MHIEQLTGFSRVRSMGKTWVIFTIYIYQENLQKIPVWGKIRKPVIKR
jgi:hypothetical protein